MLPNTGNLLKQDFQIVTLPSKTYRLDQNRNCIVGYTDGLDAVKQAIYCILNTERYEYLIYSWNFGIELKRLFGKPIGFVKSELKRVIREALTQDDRILGVDGFLFEVSGRKVTVTFTVHTRFGDITTGKEAVV